MDARREPRQSANEQVKITVLGPGEVPFDGRIVNFSGRGLRLMLSREVRPGSAMKVEWNDALLLAEVCYCSQEREGFAAGVELAHALYDIHSLAALSLRFEDKSSARTRVEPVTTVTH